VEDVILIPIFISGVFVRRFAFRVLADLNGNTRSTNA
jgi:hypothetical protein